MRLLGWRRHRDVTESDFRGRGVTGTGGGRSSVTGMSGSFHTSAGSVTEMPGTSHFPALQGPFRPGIEGPGTRCRLLGPHRGLKVDSASVTVGQHGQKACVPDISVTGSDPRHGSVALPWHPRHAPVEVPPLLGNPPLSSRPQPARAVARGAGPLPGDSLRGLSPSRATACGAPSLSGDSFKGLALRVKPLRCGRASRGGGRGLRRRRRPRGRTRGGARRSCGWWGRRR